MKAAAFLLLFLLGDPAPEPADSPEWMRLYFSPHDDIPSVMVELVGSARARVWAAFYSLNHPAVAAALLEAAEAGIDVRIVMDDGAAAGKFSRARQFRAAGLLVTDYAPADFMHNKFVVIDDFLVLTGSCNPTRTGVERDDNNVVVLASAQAADLYAREFLEMWSGRFGADSPESPGGRRIEVGGTVLEIFFSPEEDCALRLISLIDGAEDSVEFACFAFTLVPVAEALIRARRRGVEVAGVLEWGQAGPYSVGRLLADGGVDVTWDRNPYYLHHKFFVIDGRIVATGSFNPSRHAREANDENLLVIHDPGAARVFREEFRRLRQPAWK